MGAIVCHARKTLEQLSGQRRTPNYETMRSARFLLPRYTMRTSVATSTLRAVMFPIPRLAHFVAVPRIPTTGANPKFPLASAGRASTVATRGVFQRQDKVVDGSRQLGEHGQSLAVGCETLLAPPDAKPPFDGGGDVKYGHQAVSIQNQRLPGRRHHANHAGVAL